MKFKIDSDNVTTNTVDNQFSIEILGRQTIEDEINKRLKNKLEVLLRNDEIHKSKINSFEEEIKNMREVIKQFGTEVYNLQEKSIITNKVGEKLNKFDEKLNKFEQDMILFKLKLLKGDE